MVQNYSSIWIALLLLSGGLFLLFCGGEMLVAGATRLARRWGMSPLFIGLTVVAFGTSMPELFVSLAATLQNHPDIMIGNVVGSNIANVGLVLGLSALLLPLPVKFSRVTRELYLLMAVSCSLALITWFGYFHRLAGISFMGVLIFYTASSYRQEANNNRENGKVGERSVSLWQAAVLVVLGLFLLAIGSDFFIDGAVDIARYFKVSDLLIGLTLAAVGTSLPELASSLAAVRRRETEILVGNVVGSNLFNLLMVLGSTAALTPFALSPKLLVRDLPVMIVFSAVLWPIRACWHRVERWHGLMLLLGYGGYLYLLSR